MAHDASITVRIAAIALFGLVFFVAGGSSTCYYPNGDSDDGHFPCGPNSSVCCAEKFQCLSNGLCVDYRYENYTRVMRGGCTDKTWGSGCPSFCKDVWPQGDELVEYCGNGNYSCCNGEDCCSRSGANILELGVPTITATATPGNSAAQPTPLTAATTSNPPSAATVTVTSDRTIVPSSTSASPIPSFSSTPGGHSSNAVAIGVGAGVGVAAVLFGSIFLIWFIKRRRAARSGTPQGVIHRSVSDNNEGSPYGAEGYAHTVKGKRSGELHELDANQAVEMDTKRATRELDGQEIIQEEDRKASDERILKTY
ncbi:hypothetical protein BDV96DRAFT_144970 [Lophiotrema nucula]|uniref:Mid2 domain-containing protein n=1 Tax=Lophiotrema nucula TaxID=690887 RepID=A0A6A5Z092_9PLEO|nr:hypothetical protein BDV96DRAFT_144970 [Lophiotrema nucula]